MVRLLDSLVESVEDFAHAETGFLSANWLVNHVCSDSRNSLTVVLVVCELFSMVEILLMVFVEFVYGSAA